MKGAVFVGAEIELCTAAKSRLGANELGDHHRGQLTPSGGARGLGRPWTLDQRSAEPFYGPSASRIVGGRKLGCFVP
jgi:hypothetical protein